MNTYNGPTCELYEEIKIVCVNRIVIYVKFDSCLDQFIEKIKIFEIKSFEDFLKHNVNLYAFTRNNK